MVDSDFHLRYLYGQILLGVSSVKIEDKNVFIRHFSPMEQSELDREHSIFLSAALHSGLSDEKTKLAELEKDSLWTDADEAKIENQQFYLRGLVDSKKNLVLASQVAEQNKLIEEAQKDLDSQLSRRSNLLGLTAELFANKKLSERYIFNSVFKDKNCNFSLFSDEEFEYLEIEELNTITTAFNTAMRELNDQTIKKIAISRFFQDIFSLCDDNIFYFYGKPIVSLTFKQSELAGCGRFFKSILYSDPKPPDEIKNDPDKLIEWHQTSKNAEKIFSGNDDKNVVIMGGTPEDLKVLSQQEQGEVISMNDLAKGRKEVRGLEFMKMLR